MTGEIEARRFSKAKKTFAEVKAFAKAKGEHSASTTLGFTKSNLSFAEAKLVFTSAKEDKAN